MFDVFKNSCVHEQKKLLVQTQEQFPDIANLHIFKSAEYVVNKHKTPGVQPATGL